LDSITYRENTSFGRLPIKGNARAGKLAEARFLANNFDTTRNINLASATLIQTLTLSRPVMQLVHFWKCAVENCQGFCHLILPIVSASSWWFALFSLRIKQVVKVLFFFIFF
jgi:hypothetical protein